MDSLTFVKSLSVSKERAQRKYPRQPERARHLADSEVGIDNGPYKFEKLSLPQRLHVLWNDKAHSKHPDWALRDPITLSQRRQRINRLFRLLWRGEH